MKTLRYQIKICGLTRNQDAKLAEELGATAIGLIFARSPRQVLPPQAANILHGLGQEIGRIGVFVDENLNTVISLADRLSLTGIQLHGNETSSFAKALKRERPHLKILKAFIINSLDSLVRAEDFACDLLLLDSPHDHHPRQPQDLSQLIHFRPRKDFYLAGKLNAINVRQAIEALQPLGVDISSGIESSPGIKSAQAMTSFFKAVAGAGL